MELPNLARVKVSTTIAFLLCFLSTTLSMSPRTDARLKYEVHDQHIFAKRGGQFSQVLSIPDDDLAFVSYVGGNSESLAAIKCLDQKCNRYTKTWVRIEIVAFMS